MNQPTSPDLRVRVMRLTDAVERMAARYGISEVCAGIAWPHDAAAYARHDRAADRRYRALLRLTHALADLATGGTR